MLIVNRIVAGVEWRERRLKQIPHSVRDDRLKGAGPEEGQAKHKEW
jgi:hypothetical protein